MHPNHMLSAMVDDRRRQLIGEAAAFRLARPAQLGQERFVRFVRHAVSSRLVRLGQGLAGTPVPAAGPQA